MKKLFVICLCIIFLFIGCDTNNNNSDNKSKKPDTKIEKTVKKVEPKKFPDMLEKNLINGKGKDIPFKNIATKKYFLFYF